MNPNSAEKSPELKENQPGDSKIHTFFFGVRTYLECRIESSEETHNL